VAHSGKRSLRLVGREGSTVKLVTRAFSPASQIRKPQCSLWARASREGVLLQVVAPVAAVWTQTPGPGGNLTTEWQRISSQIHFHPGALHYLLLTVRNTDPERGEEPFTVWIDDICLTEEPHEEYVTASPVEAVFLPERRDSLRFAEEPAVFPYALLSPEARTVWMQLQIQDVSRSGPPEIKWSGRAELQADEVYRGRVELPHVPRGAHLAWLRVYDPQTGALLALARGEFATRQAVLSVDLHGLKLSAFDEWSEPIALPTNASGRAELEITPEILYLRSGSPALFDRLRHAELRWQEMLVGYTPDWDDLAGTLARGRPRLKRVGGNLVTWQLLYPCAPHQAPTIEQISDQAGNPIAPTEFRPLREEEAEWVEYTSPFDYVDLGAPFGHHRNQPSVSYAFARVRAPHAGSYDLQFAAADRAALWINGEQVAEVSQDGTLPLDADLTRFTVSLRQGENRFLVRLEHLRGGWGFLLGIAPPLLPKLPPDVDAEGFIRTWAIVGPWNNPRNQAGDAIGLDQVYPPEEQLVSPDLGAWYTGKRGQILWRLYTSPQKWINLNFLHGRGEQDALAYAYTRIDLPQAGDYQVGIGSDDGYVLWIDGERIGEWHGCRGPAVDQEVYPISLAAGPHDIMVKVDQVGGGWSLVFRLLDAEGSPLCPTVALPGDRGANRMILGS